MKRNCKRKQLPLLAALPAAPPSPRRLAAAAAPVGICRGRAGAIAVGPRVDSALVAVPRGGARLTAELSQVRALISRVDTWEDQRRHREPQPRHAVPPAPSPQLQAAMRKQCGQILTRLRKNKICHWFNSPVDVEKLKLHDYYAVIRNPMDLGTVKENLATGRYPTHEAFAADVRLTFNNALRYNPVGHQVHRSAGILLGTFEDLYKEVVAWFEQECERLEPPMQLVPVLVQAPPVPMLLQEPPRMGAGRRPKPKARDPNKREMSEEEKHKLRVEIESLPEGKMGNVLQIVQKRSTDPALMGDEVELDFNEMDVETLWELDRFVVNWKKLINKSRRTVVRNGDDAVLTPVVHVGDDMVLVNVNPAMAVDFGGSTVNVNTPLVVDIGDSETDMPDTRAAEVEMVDEYVDIGDEMPTVNYRSVEIEKDAQVVSSSSGSGSGSSSSSDSDSRSSGDSDSGGDDARSAD